MTTIKKTCFLREKWRLILRYLPKMLCQCRRSLLPAVLPNIYRWYFLYVILVQYCLRLSAFQLLLKALVFWATFSSFTRKSEIWEYLICSITLNRSLLGRRVYDIGKINELVQSWDDGTNWGPRGRWHYFSRDSFFVWTVHPKKMPFSRYSELGWLFIIILLFFPFCQLFINCSKITFNSQFVQLSLSEHQRVKYRP